MNSRITSSYHIYLDKYDSSLFNGIDHKETNSRPRREALGGKNNNWPNWETQRGHVLGAHTHTHGWMRDLHWYT